MTPDTFMGLVASATGIVVTWSAIRNSESFSRFWLTRRIEARYGSQAARALGATSGFAMATVGISLLAGLLPLKIRESATALPATDPSHRSDCELAIR